MDSLFRVPLDLWNNILLELPSPPTTKFQNWGAGGRGSRDVGEEAKRFLELGHKSRMLMTWAHIGFAQPM